MSRKHLALIFNHFVKVSNRLYHTKLRDNLVVSYKLESFFGC